MKVLFAAFLSAFVFGIGLALAGMTLPAKVVGFLDITGTWDPSLALVMVGAIAVHAVTYRLIMKRPSPILSAKFLVPTRRDLDAQLVVGSLLFGVGWGLGGLCPGPALVALATGNLKVVVFVASMCGGIVLHRLYIKWTSAKV
ncbi:MAG: YeeE/YedE family protein [Deltaproteobacteria bacterium]|nr:YeeE/YedE family protein [Deltaproteobacteria bacterium]